MKDFLSIREFSDLSGIESSTLRYWDEIGLFSPTKRGPENGYRYYSPEQIISVNFITVLSSLDIPLKTINGIRNRRTPEGIVHLLEQQEKLLDMKMRQLRECYSIIHTRKDMINRGKTASSIDQVSIMHLDDANFILGPRNEFKEGEGFYKPFTHFCKQAKDLRINLSFPTGGLHEDWQGFMATPGEPHHFLSTDPTGNSVRKAGKHIVGFHRGYYGQFGDLPERMANFIQENSLNTTGPVYSIYLHDEICIEDPSQYLVQVSVAIAPISPRPLSETS